MKWALAADGQSFIHEDDEGRLTHVPLHSAAERLDTLERERLEQQLAWLKPPTYGYIRQRRCALCGEPQTAGERAAHRKDCVLIELLTLLRDIKGLQDDFAGGIYDVDEFAIRAMSIDLRTRAALEQFGYALPVR